MMTGKATRESTEALWQRLLHEQGPALRRIAATYEHDPTLREDLFQEICLALWKALPAFRGEASTRTFALRIAHNRGLSHGWRQGRRRSEALDAAGPLVDPAPGPESHAHHRQRRQHLQAALRTLPLGQRQVLALALEGLPQREIADVMGITENNVAVRLHRARHALEQRLTAQEKRP